MTHQKWFEFNAFAENTYIIYNDQKEAIIIDPGCSTPEECKLMADFIKAEGLNPKLLLNTHCHIDHILGNHFVYKEYGLAPLLHRNELLLLQKLTEIAAFYGLDATPSPEPLRFIEEHEKITLGNIELEVIYARDILRVASAFIMPRKRNCGEVTYFSGKALAGQTYREEIMILWKRTYLPNCLCCPMTWKFSPVMEHPPLLGMKSNTIRLWEEGISLEISIELNKEVSL